jgi:hypothetical protein
MALIVYRKRTMVVPLELGFDVSADTLTSEIREKASTSAPLIATWTVSFLTDGVDGKCLLTLDDSITSTITQKKGYMDVKRVTGGEPIPLGDPIEVEFRDVVTA